MAEGEFLTVPRGGRVPNTDYSSKPRFAFQLWNIVNRLILDRKLKKFINCWTFESDWQSWMQQLVKGLNTIQPGLDMDNFKLRLKYPHILRPKGCQNWTLQAKYHQRSRIQPHELNYQDELIYKDCLKYFENHLPMTRFIILWTNTQTFTRGFQGFPSHSKELVIKSII
jgi:hypothetical protein